MAYEHTREKTPFTKPRTVAVILRQTTVKEINIKDIGNFRLNELSTYFFNTTELTDKIANKKIKDVSTSDLLHLIRRKNYTDLATLLAIKNFETCGFYGFNFNHDDKSITQQDLLKELLILDEKFWKHNQISFHQLKPIAKKNATYVNLSDKLVRQFIELKLESIIWTSEEIERIKSLVGMDTASTVHSAWEMVRQLKRSVDDGLKVVFKWKENTFDITNSSDIKQQIVRLLPDPTDFEKVIDKEVKICR